MIVLSPDAPDFTVREANDAFLNEIGKQQDEIAGKSIFDIFFIGNQEKEVALKELHKSLQAVLTTKQADKMPVVKYIPSATHNKSAKKYFECETIPLVNDSGELENILCTAKDVTEREMAVRQIKSDSKKLAAAQEIAKIGYWKLDIGKQRLFWSDEVYKIFGLDKDTIQINFSLFSALIHPEDKKTFLEARDAAYSGKNELNIEFRIVLHDGTQKWVHEIGKLEKDEKGNPVVFEGTIQDVTHSKELKISLEESNLRYNYSTKATFDAVYDWDFQSDVCYWGEGFERDFGYDPKALKDPYFWETHIHPDDHERVEREIWSAIKGTVSNWLNEYRFQKADGSYSYILDRSIIIRDCNGKAKRMIGAMQDITEKKKLQDILDKTSRLAKIGSWEIDVESETIFTTDLTREIREAPKDYTPSFQEGIAYFKEGPSRDIMKLRYEEAVQEGKPWQEDVQIYTYKGNLKWVRAIGVPEMINGKCRRIVGSYQDIDERKKTELEILHLYEEKTSILESIGDAFFRVDENWLVTYWNNEAEKVMQVSRNQITGKSLWEVFPKSVGATPHKKYQEAMITKKRVVFEYYYSSVDKWFEVSAYPYDGGLSVYFRDITERKLAQIQLNESEKRYSELFRLNPHPIWVFEPDTLKFVQVNQAAVNLYEYSEEEFLNLTVLDMRPREEIPNFMKALKSPVSKDGYISGRFVHKTKHNNIIYVEVKSKPLFMNDKEYRLAIFTDITEKMKLEQDLTRAIIRTQENERYELGAELHDNICQILASTHISMGVLSKSVNPEGKELFQQCRDYISLATQEIRNLSHRLAPAFYNDSTLEEGFNVLLNTANVEEKYNVNLYFDEAVKKANLTKDLQMNLYRILQEQLRNIVKYADCKNIDVDLLISNNKLKMRVADDGCGFDIATAKGGIGLSNMRRRIELFEGKFDVYSSPGNGCELVIDIPLKKEFMEIPVSQ